ncbi:MAG TPA: Crp/Fnr family transcriptional regulator [Dinghuibacter sp.]|uniref:Crp/Fnr family transcriptional regulator n=1 Tax=Dinghuibacter sp. TaxID=2024697 RepID=UPI002CFBB60E|nr:Crp/Fnr family transcriptional regulator [Dinghuibacter sp.]HTJ12096.1 Crp/Fnr family transcriptional regulator [Dinghuibacter sp.]
MPELFDGLSPEASLLVQTAASRHVWGRGTYLLREGAPARHIHGIEQGAVRVRYLKDGKEINLRFLFEGAFATNLKSLRSGAAADCSLVAMERTTTLTLEGSALRILYDRSPEVERWGRSLLESLLIQEQGHADLFKLYTPEERYAWLKQHEPALIQRVPQTQLASYLGVSRESLSRIRARLRK